MKTPRLLKRICAGILLFAPFITAHAVTVDVNASVNGFGAPVEVFLTAGTYNVTPIGIAQGGAYNSYIIWDTASCADPNGCTPTSPTTVTGWLNRYIVTSPNLVSATVGGNPVALMPDPSDPANDLYMASDDLYYPTELLALAAAVSSTFTVNSDGFVGFAISDSLTALTDNTGGMSLDVTPIPLPPAVWLFGAGLIGLAGIARRNTM